MSQRRLTSRDYKGVRSHTFNLRHWREFGLGLGLGLLVALVVFVSDRRSGALDERGAEALAASAERRAGASRAGAGDDETVTTTQVEDFTFYDMLPKFEVVVPEQERDVKRVSSAARIEQPGTYFLQAGSYRQQADAERVATQLSRQDIGANVQRVAVDSDVWHRVRIGPIKDLAQLNRLRQQLQAAEIETLVIRVPE